MCAVATGPMYLKLGPVQPEPPSWRFSSHWKLLPHKSMRRKYLHKTTWLRRGPSFITSCELTERKATRWNDGFLHEIVPAKSITDIWTENLLMLLLSRRLINHHHLFPFLHSFISVYEWWSMLHPVDATQHLFISLAIISTLHHLYNLVIYLFHNDTHIFRLLIVEILCVHPACNRFHDDEGHFFWFPRSLCPIVTLIMSSISTVCTIPDPFGGQQTLTGHMIRLQKIVANYFQTGGCITGRLVSSIGMWLGHRKVPDNNVNISQFGYKYILFPFDGNLQLDFGRTAPRQSTVHQGRPRTCWTIHIVLMYSFTDFSTFS